MRLPVLATRLGMLAEVVVRCFWPLWTVVLVAVSPLMLGLHVAVPLELVWGWTAAGVIGAVIALWFGIRRFRLPTPEQALARVDGHLPGRPIAALMDAQAIGAADAGSLAVWRAHLDRMWSRSKQARPVEPDLRLASRDPFGLRYVALLFFVVALMFGSIWRIGQAVQPAPSGAVAQTATGPVWEGWIEPPAYTGLPTLYLADQRDDRLAVPVGSQITLRFYGEIGALTLAETVSGRVGDAVPAASDQQQVFAVTTDGVITIAGEGGRDWQISVLPDQGPTVVATGAAEADAKGVMSQPFRATDDYGVTSGMAVVALDLDAVDRRHGLATPPDPIAPIIVDLPLPISRDRSAFDEVLSDDFSQSVLSRLPVTVTLSVQDAIGQTGTATPIAMMLPGRRFFQPVAQALIEQRRDLLWADANAPRVAQILRALVYRPDDLGVTTEVAGQIVAVIRQIEATPANFPTEEKAQIAQTLWDIALQLEEGALADALARLQRAQDRLAEAMRDGASPAEIQELMDELRDATRDYMQMLAERAEPGEDGADMPDQIQQAMEFSQDEINALMDRIQQLMEEGRMAEAQALMEQLNQLLENMEVTQGDGSSGQNSPGQQSMQQLGETLRQQQQLSDDAFRDLQDQFGQGQQGQPDSEELADRQRQLEQMLDDQRQNLPNLPGEQADTARRSLEQAQRSMDQAADALREGDLPQAIDRQSDAMDALRDGLRNLGEAIAQAERPQDGGQGQEPGNRTAQTTPRQTDPLGRQAGTTGQSGTDQQMLQGENVYRRAGELLDEIRRRAEETQRPEDERSYLRRLLELF